MKKLVISQQIRFPRLAEVYPWKLIHGKLQSNPFWKILNQHLLLGHQGKLTRTEKVQNAERRVDSALGSGESERARVSEERHSTAGQNRK